jgi:hypothetical protein
MLERTLASAVAVRSKAQVFQRKEVASLRIGLAPSISVSLVLEPIAEIAKFVPGLHVELREETTDKLLDLLLGGEINAAVVGDVQDMPLRIDDWPLFEERYVALLAPTHQLANRPMLGIDELRETTLLRRAGCDVAPKIQKSYFPEEPPHLGHCSKHDLHLQHMAAAGFGVILAPEHTRPRLTHSSRSRGYGTGRSRSPRIGKPGTSGGPRWPAPSRERHFGNRPLARLWLAIGYRLDGRRNQMAAPASITRRQDALRAQVVRAPARPRSCPACVALRHGTRKGHSRSAGGRCG